MPNQNEKRIEQAQIAFSAYMEGPETSGQSFAENLTDLMVALKHFADANGINFDDCLKVAATHHKAETDSDDFGKWTDLATHAVELWIRNNREANRHYRNLSAFVSSQAKSFQKVVVGQHEWVEKATVCRVADMMEQAFRDDSPLSDGSIYGELLDLALIQVDWRAIAVSYLDDATD
jgi:hypothetical protein